MFARESLDELESRLSSVDAKIAAHPLSAEPVREAHAIIERLGKHDTEAVQSELAARGLPDLAELGRIQASNTYGWWKLHREREKLVKKIAKARG